MDSLELWVALQTHCHCHPFCQLVWFMALPLPLLLQLSVAILLPSKLWLPPFLYQSGSWHEHCHCHCLCCPLWNDWRPILRDWFVQFRSTNHQHQSKMLFPFKTSAVADKSPISSLHFDRLSALTSDLIYFPNAGFKVKRLFVISIWSVSQTNLRSQLFATARRQI